MEENKGTAKESVGWGDHFSQLADKSQLFLKKICEKKMPASAVFQMIYFNQLYQKFLTHLLTQPEKLLSLQTLYWQELFFTWQKLMLNDSNSSQSEPDEAHFKFVKDFYLLHVRHFQALLAMAEGLDKKTVQQLHFYLKQITEAVSPANFAATNPEVWRKTVETAGENLLKGLDNALSDLDQGEHFQIKMTDSTAFAVGENVALTPGQVIYQNEIMQLLQYEPQTKQVFQRPLLMIPPWINKYYILDLTPALSLVNWLVQQGYTVFIISWVNPTAASAKKDFADYLLEGPLQALEVIEKATGQREVNALGYCVGGTLLGATLAYLAYRQEKRIHSATYLCALLDFSEPGELGALIDPAQVAVMDKDMQSKGIYEGQQMAASFNLLRPKDLIWSYYIKNYLLGESPEPHELLFWNSDSTNIPAALHRFYLRNMYLENKLTQSDQLTLLGAPIDLRRVKAPAFFISTLHDHIAPWKSVYAGLKLHSGPAEFVLGGSGHIAGAINPPERNKYNYYVNADSAPDSEAWFKAAKEEAGSWWPYWEQWLSKQSGQQVAARSPGDTGLALLEKAPGSYVRVSLAAAPLPEKEEIS